MKSDATTVAAYLAALPEDRRKAIETVRKTIRKHLPKGYVEGISFGMIGYYVPLEFYPDTYNGQPLMYAALAAQKNYNSVYLMAIYMDGPARERFEAAFEASGKRLDAGKSCVRFKTAEDLPLEVIGEAIELLPMDEYVRRAKAVQAGRKKSG
jgi:uncharacterized protein YdhG (YjbR/CyaY superfamily)